MAGTASTLNKLHSVARISSSPKRVDSSPTMDAFAEHGRLVTEAVEGVVNISIPFEFRAPGNGWGTPCRIRFRLLLCLLPHG